MQAMASFSTSKETLPPAVGSSRPWSSASEVREEVVTSLGSYQEAVALTILGIAGRIRAVLRARGNRDSNRRADAPIAGRRARGAGARRGLGRRRSHGAGGPGAAISGGL